MFHWLLLVCVNWALNLCQAHKYVGCVCVLCCMRGVCTLYDIGTGADAEGVPEGWTSTESGWWSYQVCFPPRQPQGESEGMAANIRFLVHPMHSCQTMHVAAWSSHIYSTKLKTALAISSGCFDSWYPDEMIFNWEWILSVSRLACTIMHMSRLWWWPCQRGIYTYREQAYVL